MAREVSTLRFFFWGDKKGSCTSFRLFFLFFIVFSLLCSCFSLSFVSSSPTTAFKAAGNEKSVDVAVQASWSETPLAQEALEWAARGGAGEASLQIFPSSSSDHSGARILDGFFFLEELWNSALLSSPRPLPKWTPEEQFSLVQKVVRTFLSHTTFISATGASRTTNVPDDSALLSDSAKAKLARFEVEMSARVYSPAVEAHYAIAATAISSLSPATLSDTDVSKTSFSCAGNDPFVFFYASSHSAPIRLTSSAELLRVHKDFIFPVEKGDEAQRGMEKWRREIWLGDDADGSSFLHLYPSSPSLADADAVVVLFGAPLEITTIRWYESIKKWLSTVTNSRQTPQMERDVAVLSPSISSSFRVRFLFGHLPLSAEKRCRVVFQNSERKRRILSLYGGKPDALRALSSSSTSWWERPLSAQGYGVEVNVRSLPSINRKPEPYEEDRTQTIPEENGEVRGFMISKLASRYPSLSELLHFFAAELDRTTSTDPLPVNEGSDSFYHHFGYSMLLYLSVRNQAEAAKLRNPHENIFLSDEEIAKRQLETLSEVSSNIPTYAPQFASLISNNYDPSSLLQEELDLLSSYFFRVKFQVFLNKKPVTKGNENIYGILRSMKQFEFQKDRMEEIFTTRFLLQEAGHPSKGKSSNLLEYDPFYATAVPIINSTMTDKVMTDIIRGVKDQMRSYTSSLHSILPFDWSLSNRAIGNIPSRMYVDESIVFWMNDVEHDDLYVKFPIPKSLNKLFYYAGPQKLVLPRLNALNLVFVVDPTTDSCAAGLKDLIRVLSTRIPVRVGFLLAVESWGFESSRADDFSPEDLGKEMLTERDYLLKQIEEYGDTPFDLEELNDGDGRALLHGKTRLGAFALMLEVMLKIQGLRYRSDGSREEKVGVDTARMVASVNKVLDFFSLLDSDLSEANEPRESVEEKRYNKEKKMLILLRDFLQLSEEMNPGWSDEDTTDTLYNYYIRLRVGMGSFSFPYFPAVLLNGAIITDKRSLLTNIQAESDAIQKAITEAQLLPSTSVEKVLPLVMRLFHASKRNRRVFDESLPLTFWNFQTLPFSWVRPLLAFYEQSVFITGGLQSISKTAEIPPSPVSGVFIFPREPTLRTLDLLERSLEAANLVGKSFRFTFVPFIDCNFSSSSMRIERLLHSLLTDTYGERDESLFSLQDMLPSSEGEDASKSSSPAKNTPSSRMNLRKINLDKIRFEVLHRFLKLMINLANTLDLPFDTTMLSDPFLWSSLEEVIKNLSNSDDALLFQYLSPMMQDLKMKELRGGKGTHFSTTKPLLQEQRHCRIFSDFITHQAAVQGKLGRSLGLEPLLRKEESAELSSPLSSHTRLVLLLHGNAFFFDCSYTAEDIAEVVHRATPLAEAVLQSLKRVPFSNTAEPLGLNPLSSVASLPSSSLPDLSNWKSRMVGVTPNFLSARTALLSAFLSQSTDGVSDIFSPVEALPELASNSKAMYRFSSPLKGSVRHELLLIVDPIQRDGKKLLHLARYFAHSPIAMDISIYMNAGAQSPSTDSFFNFVATPRIEFDSQTGQVKAAAARFTGLPQDRALGLTLVENPSWNVFPIRSPDYDLDNFVLSSIGENVSSFSVMYEIQSLVMSGKVQAPHRRDMPPPSKSYRALGASTGLSLSFTACHSEMPGAMSPTVKNYVRESMVISDSQTYFQVVLVPGLWTVSINGPLSSYFYLSEIEERSTRKEKEWWSSLSSNDASNTNVKKEQGQRIPIMINSFHFSSTSLTYDRSWDHRTNIKEVLKQEYKRKSEEPKRKKEINNAWKKPSLNIFAVASGKMYEQFLRTMIETVFRTSALSEQADVDLRGRILKFWLLENFLSPKFKTSIVKMANFYGFEIGFVTYNWPDWIEEPEDKMRKLWAYKILFLDALFPLEVERILYLDAEEISLTDLHELYNMDFQSGGVFESPTNNPSSDGRDSRLLPRRSIEESPTIALPRVCSGLNANLGTRKHRFWEVNGGFWKNYLKTYSFHSSALFVVDLQRFRAMGHGNVYRDEFISFIRNPQGTISSGQEYLNLLQKKVPIYTLPDNWLWCDAWCNPVSKKKAKILDVCENPSVKRSKIEAARLMYRDWDALQIQLDELFDSLENCTAGKKEIVEDALPSTSDAPREIITDDL